MRKITQESIDAFYNFRSFKKSNMEVTVLNEDNQNGWKEAKLYLHGNCIAILNQKTGLTISNAGWQSNTTKERLNGLHGVNIFQKNWTWFLNGKEWNGDWINIL